jgi:K+-transporting ATPase KdpF subunit
MDTMHLIALLVSAALFAYLVYALLNAENM